MALPMYAKFSFADSCDRYPRFPTNELSSDSLKGLAGNEPCQHFATPWAVVNTDTARLGCQTFMTLRYLNVEVPLSLFPYE